VSRLSWLGQTIKTCARSIPVEDIHGQLVTPFGNACSDMACWQDFEWVTLAMMPMFLFSTTFFP
jgi:hypothetical protein